MIFPALISLVFGIVCGGDVQPSKCSDCRLKHYEVKGCTPVYEKGFDCPVRFNCPEKKFDDPTICFFNQKTFKIGEKIDNIKNPCLNDCSCERDDDDKAKINCPITDCGNPISSNDTCYEAYKENECCPYLQCPDEASKKIVCDYDGKTYRYGESIVVGETKACFCNERWSGPEGASCMDIGCYMLERFERELHGGCVPIYYEDGCCPVEFLCGEDTKEVITKSLATKEDIGSGNTCVFKDTHFKRGQTLDYKGKDSCLTCSCDTPPDFTCVGRTKCPEPPVREGTCKSEHVPGQCCPTWSCIL